MNNFDPYNVFWLLLQNTPSEFLLQGHICHVNKKIINHGHGSKVTLVLIFGDSGHSSLRFMVLIFMQI